MSQLSPDYWENRATELSRTSLETVRASATAWTATTTTLMGVFGTVAIIKGPQSLSELGDFIRVVVVTLLVLAAALAVISILATARAGRGPTKRYAPLNGLRLAKWTKETTRKSRKALLVGQITGMTAAILILSAGVVATVAAARPDKKGDVFLVRTTAGAVQCGVLRRSGAKLELVDDKGAVVLDLGSGVADIRATTSCPPGDARQG
jgi:hypothetical protein